LREREKSLREREKFERERKILREREREKSFNEMLVLLYIPFSRHRYTRHPSMCNPRSGYLPNT
jgi:hypothetical protein